MNTDNFKIFQESFDNDGFVHIEGFLSPQEISDMEENIDRVIRDVAPGLPKSRALYVDYTNSDSLKGIECLDEYDSYFAELAKNPKITDLAKVLLRDDVVSKGVHYFSKPPRWSKDTPPHQDSYYFCITPNEAATIWMALDDMDEENGAVIYVAGSHKKGVLPHNASYVLGFSQGLTEDNTTEFGRPVVCKVKRGDCLVHHSLMIHSAGTNSSETRKRRAISSVYYAKRANVDPELQLQYRESVQRQQEALIGADILD